MNFNRKHKRSDLTAIEQRRLAQRLTAADPLLKDASLLWRVREISAPTQTHTLQLGNLCFVCAEDTEKS